MKTIILIGAIALIFTASVFSLQTEKTVEKETKKKVETVHSFVDDKGVTHMWIDVDGDGIDDYYETI